MAQIDHEIRIAAPVNQVYRALTTAAGIKGWNTPNVQGSGAVGSEWQLAYTGRPGFRWRIAAADADRRVVWECAEGPGDSVGTSIVFELASQPDGRTLLTCQHVGWPGAQGNFRKCNTTWGVLLHHLKQHVETSVAAPAFS